MRYALLLSLLAVFSIGCPTMTPPVVEAPPTPPDPRSVICQEPSATRWASIITLLRYVLPFDPEANRYIDVPPGTPLPPEVNPPKHPELYGAAEAVASWVQTCFPEKLATPPAEPATAPPAAQPESAPAPEAPAP